MVDIVLRDVDVATITQVAQILGSSVELELKDKGWDAEPRGAIAQTPETDSHPDEERVVKGWSAKGIAETLDGANWRGRAFIRELARLQRGASDRVGADELRASLGFDNLHHATQSLSSAISRVLRKWRAGQEPEHEPARRLVLSHTENGSARPAPGRVVAYSIDPELHSLTQEAIGLMEG